jgi:hypothetical protein
MVVNDGPSHEKMKVYSKHLKEKYKEISTGQLRKTVYGDQSLIMNFINYVMNQK